VSSGRGIVAQPIQQGRDGSHLRVGQPFAQLSIEGSSHAAEPVEQRLGPAVMYLRVLPSCDKTSAIGDHHRSHSPSFMCHSSESKKEITFI
jgi:hypothetical protein